MTDSSRERLLRAWRGEIVARYVYLVLARRERDPERREILTKIGDAEGRHRSRIEARLRELGVEIPSERTVHISPWLRLQARFAPTERLLQAREAAEDDEALGVYGSSTGDAETDQLLGSIRQDERSHSMAMDEMQGQVTPDPGVQDRLNRILRREEGRRGGSWISDAIYGVNDGLAAVFGIVAGVSGATAGSSFVLTAGLAGAVASAVSMGVGAWLAERSESEMSAAHVAQERAELKAHAAEEKEELTLFYQLKGMSRQDASELVEHLSRSPEVMLETMVTQELGGLNQGGNAWSAALAGLVSTALGAVVPVIPFFIVHGYVAVIWAGAISIAAHFGVGAAKSVVTLRTWWGSGLEMTAAGILVGGVTYGLGVLFRVFFGG